jgi:hypothetical protein
MEMAIVVDYPLQQDVRILNAPKRMIFQNSDTTLKYGVVPGGYKQIYPENNLSPPLIVEGETYRYMAQIVSAPWAVADFKLVNGKVIEVKNYTDH